MKAEAGTPCTRWQRAVASIEKYDGGFALDALITAEDAAIYAGSLRDDAQVDAIASMALRLLPERDSATPAELLVGGIAIRLTDGYAASAPMLRNALAGLRQQVEEAGEIATPNAHERANVLHLLAVSAAVALLDDGALEAVTRSWVDFGRRTRTLTTLPIALDTRSVAEILAARFRAAASAIAEAEEILSLVGSRGHIGDPGLGELLLHAYRGDEEKTRDAAERRARDAQSAAVAATSTTLGMRSRSSTWAPGATRPRSNIAAGSPITPCRSRRSYSPY